MISGSLVDWGDELIPMFTLAIRLVTDTEIRIERLKIRDMYYPINYGYVEGIMAPDGEEQDVYILGVGAAVEMFTGTVIAVVHRNDDVEEKWVI